MTKRHAEAPSGLDVDILSLSLCLFLSLFRSFLYSLPLCVSSYSCRRTSARMYIFRKTSWASQLKGRRPSMTSYLFHFLTRQRASGLSFQYCKCVISFILFPLPLPHAASSYLSPSGFPLPLILSRAATCQLYQYV